MVMSDTRPAPGDLQFLKFHHQKYLFEQIVSQCILIYCALYKVRDSLMAQTVGKASACKCGRPGFDPRVGKIVCRRKWQPTPVLLPGKFHGWRSPIGYSLWGHKESDMTKWLHFALLLFLIINRNQSSAKYIKYFFKIERGKTKIDLGNGDWKRDQTLAHVPLADLFPSYCDCLSVLP